MNSSATSVTILGREYPLKLSANAMQQIKKLYDIAEYKPDCHADAAFMLRRNDLVSTDFLQDLTVSFGFCLGDHFMNAVFFSDHDAHDAGFQIVGHADNDSVHIAQAELADLFFIRKVGNEGFCKSACVFFDQSFVFIDDQNLGTVFH